MTYKVIRVDDRLSHGGKATATHDGYELPGRHGRDYKYIYKYVKDGKTRYVYQSTHDKNGNKKKVINTSLRTDYINRYNDNKKYAKQETILKNKKSKATNIGEKTKVNLQLIGNRVMKALNNIGTSHLDDRLNSSISKGRKRLYGFLK